MDPAKKSPNFRRESRKRLDRDPKPMGKKAPGLVVYGLAKTKKKPRGGRENAWERGERKRQSAKSAKTVARPRGEKAKQG